MIFINPLMEVCEPEAQTPLAQTNTRNPSLRNHVIERADGYAKKLRCFADIEQFVFSHNTPLIFLILPSKFFQRFENKFVQRTPLAGFQLR
jgi:hypothetical protein